MKKCNKLIISGIVLLLIFLGIGIFLFGKFGFNFNNVSVIDFMLALFGLGFCWMGSICMYFGLRLSEIDYKESKNIEQR